MIILCRLLLAMMVLQVEWYGARGEKQTYKWDDRGYILYCPCMGRFGNQAAHFLGSLEFAKTLNRTFVIPPWRSYKNVRFTDWFELEPVQSYHKAILMEDFLEQLAPTHWPPSQRTGYCYRATGMANENDCEMKYGNPFGPFWEELGVDFVDSNFTSLGYDVRMDFVRNQWETKYPAEQHPVIALKGAPAKYPVRKEHRHLQKYLKWSKRKLNEAQEYINNTIGDNPYIAIHLRMGKDWEKACESAVGRDSFMESGQCLEDIPNAKIDKDVCLPSMEVVKRHLLALLRKTGIKSLFVASDVEAEKYNMQTYIGRRYGIYYLSPQLPQLDLVVMSKADYFIGNCVSSFTAFVKRDRDVNNKPTEFFGLEQLKINHAKQQKTEL
ncbi:GDP-fucose protein O-fucosyltransferase 1-like isoform X2 [Halichondria panicea]|uniref:GDP-fucose protein O-fucosyltransferase 1-like isoform X2 n=1 Tax=Halichondria panicea TaxID=6063 RepID=UPI00312B4B69